MKHKILERYEKTSDGELIVDVSAEKIEDLYDDFDKKSHFMKKDLNQELVDYITQSVSEIGDEKFIIQFNLEMPTNEENIFRVKNSVNRFFIYMKELESRKMQEMVGTSLILFVIGLVLATISVLMNQSQYADTSVAFGVIAEGLTVAAWVSLWESLATFLIKWIPNKKKIRIYDFISNAKVVFNFTNN